MTLTLDTPSLAARFAELRTENPKLRPRDAAERLGVSEGELTEARGSAEEIRRLAPTGAALAELLKELRGTGPVMCLVRNEACVHEVTGLMGEVEAQGMVGQVTGEIDLRLFLRQWHAAFHVVDGHRSIQIFGPSGEAVIKVYAREGSDLAAWDALLARHAAPDAAPVSWSAPAAPAAEKPDAEIDREALLAGWRTLRHTHEFHGLLRATGSAREQALRLAGAEFAEPLAADAPARLLEAAAASGVPIMCFVGNAGAIQIYTGKVGKIVPMGPWLNVLDPGFNLHLRADKVARAWLVRKPTTERGLITSVELFDAAGELIAQFFGQRAEGGTENPAWRALAEGLKA